MIPEGVTNAESVAAIVQYFGLLNTTAPEFSLVGDAKNWFKLGKVGTVKQQNYNLYSVPIVTKADTDIKYAETEKGIYSVKVSAGKDAVADINVEVLSFGPPAAEDKVTTASPIKKKESSPTKIPVEETTLTDTRSRAVEKNETSSLPIESVISDGHKVNSTDDVTLVETTTSEFLTTPLISRDDEFVTMEKQTAPTTESSISLTSDDVKDDDVTETTTEAMLSKEATINENAEDITSEVSSDNSNESENITTTVDAAWEPLAVNRFIAENQATIQPSFDETTEAIVEEVGFPEDSSEVTIETPVEQDEDLSTIVDISLEDLEAKLKAEAGEPITVTTTESAAMKTLEKIFKELEDEEKEKEIEKEEPEFVLTPELLETIDGSTQLIDNDEVSTTTTAEPDPEPEAGSYPKIELQLVDLQTQLPVQELAVTKMVYPEQVVENFEIRNALDDSVSKEMLELSVEPSDIFDITPHYVLSKMPAKIIVKNQHNFAKNEETEITVRAKYADYSNQIEAILTLSVTPTAKFGLTPSFNDTIYEFNVPENSRTGDFVGELFAVDNTAKNGSALIYSLIGKNSDLFTMDGGKIVVLCNANKTCLDYEEQKEYYLIAIATNLAGVSSDPVTIVVHVNDVNDNAPQLVLSDPVLKIQNGQLEPFTIKVADNDTTEVNANSVELQGSASKFLAVEEVDEKTHRVQFVGVPEIGTYLLDILVNDSSNPDIETSKISVPVEVLNTNGRARFSQARYTRRINADKLHKGNPLVQLIFNGQPLETVQFVFLSKNPGWFSLEDFGGNIFVGDIPRNGIPSGEYSITVGALDRQTGKVIDRAVVSVEVEGVQESRSIFKTKVFSHVFPQQELSKDIVLKPLEKGEKRRLMIVPESINAWGDQRDSIQVPSSIVKASENAIVIDAEPLKSIRGIQFEGVAIDNPNDRALFTVYVSSDPEDYEKQRLERSKPQFTAPWVDENQAIPVTLPEEAPLNHNVLHIRAFDPSTGKSIKKITVNGAMADFFSYNYEKGSLVTSKLIDYESLDSASRVFDLQVVAEHPLSSTTANLVVTIQNIDDNAPEIMLAGSHPVQRPLNLRVTENSDPGKVLIKFMIRDGDTEVEKHLFDKFTYALSGEGAANFEIRQGNNSINLVTSSSANLDREHTKENVVMLQVSDEAGNTDILPMFIETVDENDNRPMLESTSRYMQAVENWPIGTVLARIAAVDKDEEDNGRLSFALGGEASKFIAIHPDSGTIRTIASLHGLAAAEPYRFQVIVSDHGTPSFSTTTDFDIRIVEAFNAGDKDEQGIRFSAPATDFVLVVPEDTPSNARLLTAKAQSSQPADSHERNIRYSLEPVTSTDDGWLNINPTNGDVFAQSTFDYEKQKFISFAVHFLMMPVAMPHAQLKTLVSMAINDVFRNLRKKIAGGRGKRRGESANSSRTSYSKHSKPRTQGNMSASTVDLGHQTNQPPTSVEIQYRRESDPHLLIPNELAPSDEAIVQDLSPRPFRRNPSKRKHLYADDSVLTFKSLTKRKSKSATRDNIPYYSDSQLQPQDEAVWERETYKTFEIPIERLEEQFMSTTTTHFPVHVHSTASQVEPMDLKEREMLNSPTGESGYDSGRQSGLELSMPPSQNVSQFSSPLSSNNSAAQRRTVFLESPKSLEVLNDIETTHRVPILVEKPHDDIDIKPEGLLKPNLRELATRPYSKSERYIKPFARSSSADAAVRFLKRRVRETKYITAVFEAATGGLAEMLDDVLKEFTLWLGEKSSLLGIAVEMHWSVPEKLRSRTMEIKLKDNLHQALRNNNRRVLSLYEECREHLPTNFTESKTEENCSRDTSVSAFQGIYRRFYPELFSLQDKKTVKSHSTYWTFENIAELTRNLPAPNPGRFLFHGHPEQLRDRSIVYLIATNVYNETQNASRLLRVQVQNTDDNAPEFAVNSDKTGLLTFVVDDTTDADQQKQSVGRLVAFDADAAPFNDIYYYLVPACNPETSHYDIDQKSGEIFQLKTAGNDTKELQTLCALASSDPNLSADALRTIDMTAINGSFIKFAVRQLSNMIQSEMEHKSVPFAANNTVVIIDSSAKEYNIPLDFLSTNESSEYLYKLENVNFYPVEKNVESTSLSLPSVFVNPSNADVRLDPEITETAEGIYSLLIRTFNTADGRQSEPITSQVHRIDNKNRLKFVFDVPVDSLGLKLAEFQERFNNIMQQNTSTSGVRAVFSDPKVYADRWHVRSSVCFHLTRPTEILPLDDTITLTATKTNANDKLMSLYQVFNVVNIDSCQANVAVANATESAGLSKSLLLWITLVLVVLLILFSLVAYTCFVARYRDFLIKQNEQLKEVQKPIPPFAIPQFIDPRHL
uniref:Cadherin domain-containing protein n=1 Tax=Panagrellus redivivus TaxID=6233 RepID=A0A7E5A0V6_PANRE